MSKVVTDWSLLAIDAEQIMRSSEDVFDHETIENVRDFLRFASNHLQVADSVAQGYWPTIRILWSMPHQPNIEVEVHERHYEYYGSYDGRLDIRHYDHIPGEPIPADFVELLPQKA